MHCCNINKSRRGIFLVHLVGAIAARYAIITALRCVFYQRVIKGNQRNTNRFLFTTVT